MFERCNRQPFIGLKAEIVGSFWRIRWLIVNYTTLILKEEELYQMTDAAAIADRNARMRTNRIPESASFPSEQERLYGYDAEAVLRAS